MAQKTKSTPITLCTENKLFTVLECDSSKVFLCHCHVSSQKMIPCSVPQKTNSVGKDAFSVASISCAYWELCHLLYKNTTSQGLSSPLFPLYMEEESVCSVSVLNKKPLCSAHRNTSLRACRLARGSHCCSHINATASSRSRANCLTG